MDDNVIVCRLCGETFKLTEGHTFSQCVVARMYRRLSELEERVRNLEAIHGLKITRKAENDERHPT